MTTTCPHISALSQDATASSTTNYVPFVHHQTCQSSKPTRKDLVWSNDSAGNVSIRNSPSVDHVQSWTSSSQHFLLEILCPYQAAEELVPTQPLEHRCRACVNARTRTEITSERLPSHTNKHAGGAWANVEARASRRWLSRGRDDMS